MLVLQNPVCILHLIQILVQTGLISSALWPHMAGGYHIGNTILEGMIYTGHLRDSEIVNIY